LDVLYEENIQSVIVEGGSQTLQTFIDANLWDEARVFVSENTFNEGVVAPKLPKNRILTSLLIKKDQLKLFRNYD
jgi:diaminohydroxyphosphoribosylaminopyrimidine deaminase / 5-amino-6-(5-phosphoribosylamino)uracil reductase